MYKEPPPDYTTAGWLMFLVAATLVCLFTNAL